MQRPASPRPGIGIARRVEVEPPRTRKQRSLGLGPLQRFEPADRLSRQLVTLDQPVARRLAAHVGDVDKSAAGEHIEPTKDLAHTEQDGPAHPIVERGVSLARGAVSQLLVAVADHPLEQFAKPDRDTAAGGAIEDLAEGGVEPGGAWQVVALATEDEFPHLAEPLVAGLGHGRHEEPDELPPVSQGWPRRFWSRSASSGATAPRSA